MLTKWRHIYSVPLLLSGLSFVFGIHLYSIQFIFASSSTVPFQGAYLSINWPIYSMSFLLWLLIDTHTQWLAIETSGGSGIPYRRYNWQMRIQSILVVFLDSFSFQQKISTHHLRMQIYQSNVDEKSINICRLLLIVLILFTCSKI